MSKKAMTTVPFTGTKEQENQLKAVIAECRDMGGALMPILQKAQDIYGYLPAEVQQIVAEELDMPFEEIYGVVTFYTQFTLNPKGKYNISVCMGTACYVKGSGDLLEAVEDNLGISDGGCTPDGKFSLDATRCLGCCGLAPLITVNEDVYGRLTKDDVKSVLEKY